MNFISKFFQHLKEVTYITNIQLVYYKQYTVMYIANIQELLWLFCRLVHNVLLNTEELVAF